MRQASHDEAIAVLRLTTQRVQLCVFRHQESYREEDLWDVFSLELWPRPGEGLGFTTVGKRYSQDAFIKLPTWYVHSRFEPVLSNTALSSTTKTKSNFVQNHRVRNLGDVTC